MLMAVEEITRINFQVGDDLHDLHDATARHSNTKNNICTSYLYEGYYYYKYTRTKKY